MATDKKVMLESGARNPKPSKGGKTNEDMLKLGRNEAKLKSQFGSVKLGSKGR